MRGAAGNYGDYGRPYGSPTRPARKVCVGIWLGVAGPLVGVILIRSHLACFPYSWMTALPAAVGGPGSSGKKKVVHPKRSRFPESSSPPQQSSSSSPTTTAPQQASSIQSDVTTTSPSHSQQASSNQSHVSTALPPPSNKSDVSTALPPPSQPVESVDTLSGSVLYMVGTWHKKYPTLARAITKTWGANLGKRLLLVGDVPSKELPGVAVADQCESSKGGHGAPHICKLFYGLLYSFERMKELSLSWVLVLDDDVYVVPQNVDKVLGKAITDKKIALGCGFCGTGVSCQDKKGGLCGGCGIAINFAALAGMIGSKSSEEFVAEGTGLAASPLASTGKTQWGDMAMSCMLKNSSAKLDRVKEMKGMHGWRLKTPELYVEAIHSKAPEPLTFHYLDADKMYWMHNEFGKSRRMSSIFFDALSAQRQERDYETRYDQQLQQYISEMDAVYDQLLQPCTAEKNASTAVRWDSPA